ncbi:hypothetical protein QCA50_001879 [Cerrena zonata]|uniref:Uncharacterized protein n=1 Tax=Cerrena zonata TaxID=2478898 RepID=A0AAW0GPK8_9APHY
MSWDGVRLAVIILDLLGIVLLLALLATPAPKHAIVNALAVAAILRSICSVIPPMVYLQMPEMFDAMPLHSKGLQNLCIWTAILTRYLTVVKAAYTVSFTLPLLYLARQHSKQSVTATSTGKQVFFTRTVALLTIGPFLWALPAILIPLPTIINNRHALHPMFVQATCAIYDNAYQIVSLTQMILPLVLATIVSVIFVSYLWKSAQLPLASHSLGLIDLTRIIRFGALLGIIVLSAILYAFVMGTWARDHLKPRDPMPARTVFMISTIWESVTPILFFLIFGAQEEVFTIWRSWFHGFYKCARSISHHPRSSYGSSTAYLDFHDDQGSRFQRICRIFRFRRKRQASTGIHFPSDMSNSSFTQDYEKRPPSIPAHFLPSTIPISLSQGIQVVVKTSCESSYDTDTSMSLRPPPRHTRSINESPTVERLSSHPFRAVPNMPSLTALGNEDHYPASDVIEISGESAVQPVENERREEEERHEKPLLRRPNTGESSRTFGN